MGEYDCLKGKKVWVIDDIPYYRDDIVDTLKRLGVECTTFDEPLTPAAFLEQIGRGKKPTSIGRPDLIITDYDFPDEKRTAVTGEAIMSTVAHHPSLRDIPIVICSGEETLKYRNWNNIKVDVMGKAVESPKQLIDFMCKHFEKGHKI